MKNLNQETIKLLHKVCERILNEPRQLDMLYLVGKSNTCGTTACILGHAMAIQLKINLKTVLKLYNDAYMIPPTFLTYLPGIMRSRLIHFPLWPDKYKKHTREGTKAYARQAVNRIKFFIKTDGTDLLIK